MHILLQKASGIPEFQIEQSAGLPLAKSTNVMGSPSGKNMRPLRETIGNTLCKKIRISTALL